MRSLLIALYQSDWHSYHSESIIRFIVYFLIPLRAAVSLCSRLPFVCRLRFHSLVTKRSLFSDSSYWLEVLSSAFPTNIVSHALTLAHGLNEGFDLIFWLL
jgi:hypothetical protein